MSYKPTCRIKKLYAVLILTVLLLIPAGFAAKAAKVTMKTVSFSAQMEDAGFTKEEKRLCNDAYDAISDADSSYEYLGSYKISNPNGRWKCQTAICDYFTPCVSTDAILYFSEAGGGKLDIWIDAKGIRKTMVSSKNKKFIKSIKSLLKKAGVKKGLSQKAAVTKINNYLVKYLAYDYSVRNTTLYSAVKKKKTVCQGYAELFSAMCRYAGIHNRMVIGYARGDHSWNMVRLSNKWYYVDVTWNDTGRTSRYLLSNKLWSTHKKKYYTF